jgi:uncharacterized protein (TIGR03000 family)
MRSLIITAFALTTLGLLGPGPSLFAAEKQARARRATVRVLVPAGATLTINDKATLQHKGSRRFITPPLEKGKGYTYTFKAEFKYGKKSISVARTVKLRAGQKRVISLRLADLSRRGEYGANRWPRYRGRTSIYRFSPTSSPDPLFGRGSYRDMTADEDSVRD